MLGRAVCSREDGADARACRSDKLAAWFTDSEWSWSTSTTCLLRWHSFSAGFEATFYGGLGSLPSRRRACDETAIGACLLAGAPQSASGARSNRYL